MLILSEDSDVDKMVNYLKKRLSLPLLMERMNISQIAKDHMKLELQLQMQISTWLLALFLKLKQIKKSSLEYQKLIKRH